MKSIVCPLRPSPSATKKLVTEKFKYHTRMYIKCIHNTHIKIAQPLFQQGVTFTKCMGYTIAL